MTAQEPAVAKPEAKPCPFCGNSAMLVVHEQPDGGVLCYIQCNRVLPGWCGAVIAERSEARGAFESESEAIAAWNCRAGEAELVAALREAGEALETASAAICAYDDHDPSVGATCNLAYRKICVALSKYPEA